MQLHAAMSSIPGAAAVRREEDSNHEITVPLTDLRGFSSISEAHPLHTVMEVLNRYLARLFDGAPHSSAATRAIAENLDRSLRTQTSNRTALHGDRQWYL